ncbi:MAG: electron transfer flavoprotein subunit beta/FixA family protein [Planctomycetes bacterium]|nr:electron transfer flavoprotein subunit beta/FixA family protein [Planctomycetota bacterium]
MPYDCVVLAKQVPDTKNITGEAMTPEGTVNRAALPAIFNPEDLNALEAALQVKEQYGGTVTVISMGLPAASEILRDSFYRGADRVILLTDIRFARADTLATSYALSKAVKKVGRFDLVFSGRQAIDGDTAQVGPQAAEKLDIPQITYVEEIIEIKDNTIKVKKSIAGGYEIVRSRLPILLTITSSANAPRPPAAKRLMQYKKARSVAEIERELRGDAKQAPPEAVEARKRDLESKGLLIEQWDVDALGADPEKCGGKGSPTMVRNIESIVLTAGETKMIEPTEEGIRALVRELIEDHTLD